MDVGAAEAGAWLEIGSAGCGVGAGEGVGATTWAGEGIGEEGASGFWVMGSAIGGEEDAEVVVNFGGGGQSGAGGGTGMSLFHCESGGETLDRINRGGGQTLQMDPGMGGEGL